ncbi:MAG: hypothetical protein ACLFN8_01930 [Candidatus Woesearchaeota archaeon]
MGILIACLTTGKGTWAQVAELINSHEWSKIYLVTNEFGAEKFTHTKNVNFIKINLDDKINIMQDKIIAGLTELKKEIGFQDIAINFTSGTGREHAAMLSAILKIGCGIRIVYSEDKQLLTL